MYESQERPPGTGSSVPDRDSKTPGPQGAEPGQQRRQAEMERQRAQQRELRQAQQQRRQAQAQRRRASPQRGNPDQERRGDFTADPDELWPPLMGPGWRDRGTRVHRMLHDSAGRDQRGRGRNRTAPALSRAEIVDAAIAIADAEGSGAIRVRGRAQVLKAGTMSLYGHVANKEQLLDLMLDALIGEIEVHEPTGDWRADLRTQARNERAMLPRPARGLGFIRGP